MNSCTPDLDLHLYSPSHNTGATMSQRATKRRKLSPPVTSEAADDFAGIPKKFKGNAAQWDLEQDYENRPRKHKKREKENTRLPIKTAQGKLERLEINDQEGLSEADSDASSFASLGSDTPATDVSAAEPETPRLSPKEEILQAKEELAKIASLVNESPEEHVGSLKTLATITSSKNPVVTKLGLATQLSVYKDIIPGYRIRALGEEELNAKVSKDVRTQRNFEQAIVRGYQAYLKDLARLSHLDPQKDSQRLSDVAVSCACNLLEHVAHFNFRPDLLKIVIDVMIAGPGHGQSRSSFEKCCNAVEKLFEDDEDGNASLEAVGMLSKAIKGRNFRIHESVLNVFLRLRLLSEFAHKASTSRIDKSSDQDDGSRKLSKKDRLHRTKRERKIAKENKTIAKEMSEADAVVSYEQRDKNQAETLKLVFGVYFRILKARVPRLMGATLEGLVRYAHLINQDFFGDLLEALREIIGNSGPKDDQDEDEDEEATSESPQATARNALLGTVTAFGLLQGQDAAASASTLHLDLTFFIQHLYSVLHASSLDPDLELSTDTAMHAPDPEAPHAGPKARVNASTTIVLLIRALRAVLLPSNTRAVPPVRMAAFTKQLMTLATQVPERSAAAVLQLITDVVKAQRGRVTKLWRSEERKGDGVFDATASVESSNPFATSVFENELLRLHYSPRVREGVAKLDKVVADN